MPIDHVVRGVKAGLVAGLVFGLFVALVANPLVALADGGAHAEGDHHASDEQGHAHESVLSTTITDILSVGAGGLWGVLLGGVVFGAGFYLLEPALPGSGAASSLVLGGLGFLTVSGAPWLVLPPAPPGVEQSLAADTRLALYAGAIGVGAAVSLASVSLYAQLSERYSRFVTAAGALFPFSLLALLPVLTPAAPTGGSLAAVVTGVVVFGQALLWATLAGTHAWLGRETVTETVETHGAQTAD
jgi:hypothetical protein